jgi:hypothetical protein
MKKFNLSLHDAESVSRNRRPLMSESTDAFKQFQDELTKLEGTKPHPQNPTHAQNLTRAQRLEFAQMDVLALREKFDLTVAEMVSFFPDEEGLAYLQNLIVEVQSKPIRKSKAKPDRAVAH